MDWIRELIDWLKDLQFVLFLGLFLANSFFGDPFTKLLARHLALRPRPWVDRVEWSRGEWVLNQAAREVLSRYPKEFADVNDELRSLKVWLAENAETNLTEEILLVARGRFRNRINGVLYASLYKTRRTRCAPPGQQPGSQATAKGEAPHARCMVWYVLFGQGAVHKLTGDQLWRGLTAIVDREMFGEEGRQRAKVNVDYYVRGFAQDDAQEGAFREFLHAAGARLCRFPARLHYLEPAEHWDENPESAELYFASDQLDRSLTVGEVAEFVYGVAWAWAFEYSADVLDLRDLDEVIKYLDTYLLAPALVRGEEKVQLVKIRRTTTDKGRLPSHKPAAPVAV